MDHLWSSRSALVVLQKRKRKTEKKNSNSNCVPHYNWKSQSLEMTQGNYLSLFVSVLTFNEIYYPPTLLSVTKEWFKALWTWCFSPSYPCTSGAASVTQSGTIWVHNTGPKYRNFYVIMTFLIVLPTPSLHIEMVTYCSHTSYTKMHRPITKYLSIKICYKTDKFAFEGNKSKVVAELYRLKKVVPTSKKSLRNAVIHLFQALENVCHCVVLTSQ